MKRNNSTSSRLPAIASEPAIKRVRRELFPAARVPRPEPEQQQEQQQEEEEEAAEVMNTRTHPALYLPGAAPHYDPPLGEWDSAEEGDILELLPLVAADNVSKRVKAARAVTQ